MEELKKALEGEDLEEIKTKKDALSEKAMALATKVYEEAAKDNAEATNSEETDATEDKKDKKRRVNIYMNWYLQSGKESDVVVSSRIRIARNIKGYPFIRKSK